MPNILHPMCYPLLPYLNLQPRFYFLRHLQAVCLWIKLEYIFLMKKARDYFQIYRKSASHIWALSDTTERPLGTILPSCYSI